MKGKLLFVIDNLGSGGAQNQMTLLASLLKREGYDIEFFIYHPGDFFKYRLEELNIRIHKFEKSTKLGLATIRQLYTLIHQKSYDAVISFLQTPSFYTALVKHFGKSNFPLLISERFITFEKKNSLKYYLKKFSHRKASFVTTNSNHEKERLIDQGITSKDKIKTIYNVVDLDHFKPSSHHKIHQKLLCVASVSQYKNGLCVIEAMNILKTQDKLNVSITWVGKKVFSIPERADYIKLMEDKIQDYNLMDHWSWVEPTQNIKEYYHYHDALVHPSYREGLPNVVCESLASGLPVILSDILDHPILADQGTNGFLFKYSEPKELAEAILQFYKLESLELREMQLKCRTFAEANFSAKRFASEYLQIIDKIILRV